MPLQTVRDWLGHANISQTSTYLESTLSGQHEAMRRFDELHALAELRRRERQDGVQPGAMEDGTPMLQAERTAETLASNTQESVN